MPLPDSGSIYAANGNFGNTISRCRPSNPYYMIECTAKMLPDKDVWEYLIPGESRGFIDLGFELGVMPEDRAMISNYR